MPADLCDGLVLTVQAVALELPGIVAGKKLAELGVGHFCCLQVEHASQGNRAQHFIGAAAGLAPRGTQGEAVGPVLAGDEQAQCLPQRRGYLRLHLCHPGFLFGLQGHLETLLQPLPRRDALRLTAVTGQADLHPVLDRG